jgi:hypothetical protein
VIIPVISFNLLVVIQIVSVQWTGKIAGHLDVKAIFECLPSKPRVSSPRFPPQDEVRAQPRSFFIHRAKTG